MFIFMTIEDTNIKILRLHSLFPNFILNIIFLSSFSKYVKQRINKEIREYISRIWLSDDPIVF